MSEYIYGSIGDPLANALGEIYLPRAEVVRCRDCYFGKKVHWPSNSKTPSDWLDCMGPIVETWDYLNDEPQDNPVPPDGFCFWAKRRDA